MTKTSSKMKHLVRVSLCALFVVIGAVTAEAATYYVAHTGDDANSCVASQTITTPKRTFASSVACMTPGDTLYIRAGTWTEQLNVSTKSGTANAYLTYAGYPGERPCLASKSGRGGFALYGPYANGNSYIVIQNLKLDSTCDGSLVANLAQQSGWSIGTSTTNGVNDSPAPHDILIDNVEVANWTSIGLFIAQGASNITIQNSSLHDMFTLRDATGNCVNGYRWYGFYLHDVANITIQNTEIYNNPGGGIQIYPGPGTGVIVRNNKIHDNQACLTGSGFGGMVVQGTQTNTQIYNNLIYNNGVDPRSGVSTGIMVGTTATGTKVWNNTIYGNKGVGGGAIGINVGAGAINTVLQNNISYNNSLAEIINSGTGTTNDHNLTTSPLFVNAETADFRLQAGSVAIDTGVILSKVTTDFNNNARPQGFTYDIGAYEVGTTPNPPPAQPHGLTIR